jgi:hypothetical protein
MRTAQILAAVALSFAFPGCQSAQHASVGQEQQTPVLPQGQLVGEAMQPQTTHRFAVVDAEPAKFFDKVVLVEATVQAVCKKKGCWMKVEDEGKVATVRWESGCGGQFKFPMESIGKRVLIQGTFYPKYTGPDEVEHMEEEAGHKLAIPADGYEFNASSVLILEPAK